MSRVRRTELLTAISLGEVADRYHYRCGWATRWHTRDGRRVASGGRGGGLGENVTAAVSALVADGLAERADGPRPYADHPYRLTDAGRNHVLGTSSPVGEAAYTEQA